MRKSLNLSYPLISPSTSFSTCAYLCSVSIEELANPVEPLIPSELPERPWQKVGADLFTVNNSNYMLLVDYYSRFVEIAKLTLTRSEDVIVHLKSIFSRYGVPEIFYSDNEPQFSSQ